MLNQHK